MDLVEEGEHADFFAAGAETIEKLVLVYHEGSHGTSGRVSNFQTPSQLFRGTADPGHRRPGAPQTEMLHWTDLSSRPCIWRDCASSGALTLKKWRNGTENMAVRLEDMYEALFHFGRRPPDCFE